MKKNYDSIDLFKFIFSILIVALHADALYDLSPLANTLICGGIARRGVPFFFVTSTFSGSCRMGLQNNDPQYRKVLVCRPLRSFSYMAYTEVPKQKRLRMA